MKAMRYSDPQILSILRQAEGGIPVAELCREHGMSSASFYKWRAKFGGMDASMITQMKTIEDENRGRVPGRGVAAVGKSPAEATAESLA